MNKEEQYRKNPIFGADFSNGLPALIESIRREIVNARGHIKDITYGYPQWKERVQHVEGLLTCGLIALAYAKDEIIEHEIKKDDHEKGQSFSFRSRGIGLDVCPGCFICGADKRNETSNHYLHNIAAFVKTKEDGEHILNWFENKARLDYRPSEPNWIQIKIGACDKHLDNLKKLDKITSTQNHGRIRFCDITEIKK